MDASLAKRILQYLKAKRSEMQAFLDELVRLESPSTVAAAQEAGFALLAERFRALDCVTLHLPGTKTGGSLYARPFLHEKHQPTQLLLGHVDTVWPLGTLAEMPSETAGDMMRGPGVYDMKAGLAQMLFSWQCLQELELIPEVLPLFFINSDEEIGSWESRGYIGRLARIADRAFVLEPSLGREGKLKTARKGIGRFTLKLTGEPAHAGLDPGKGASAIVELANLVQQLFALNDLEKGVSVNVGMIEGGVRANVVAPASSAVVDVRVPTQVEADRITEAIFGLKPANPAVKLEVDGFIGRPPLERTPRNRQLWQRAQQAGQALGLQLEEAMAGGGSDGNTTSLFTATLDGLGAVGDGAHARHEFIYLDQLLERTALLCLLMISPPLTPS
jgi:glutamate carboxypeptidase